MKQYASPSSKERIKNWWDLLFIKMLHVVMGRTLPRNAVSPHSTAHSCSRSISHRGPKRKQPKRPLTAGRVNKMWSLRHRDHPATPGLSTNTGFQRGCAWRTLSKCKQPHRRDHTLSDPTSTGAWSVKSTEQGVTPWLLGSGGGRGGEVQSLVMVAQHCEHPKNHSTVHFKMVILYYVNLTQFKGEKMKS